MLDIVPTITVVSAGEQYGRFQIAPLEEGHAAALGNALRRVLLSSIPGAAVTKINIEGVYHEFSTIPGVREDVPELVLNVKGLRFRCYAERPVRVALVRHGAGPVRASDIDTPSNIEVINPNHYLCSLDSDNAELSIELTIERGRGALLADMRDAPLPIGEIAVDAIFSPIPKVNMVVERLASAGELAAHAAVLLEVWTDGSLKPGDALSYAAQLLVQYARAIASFGQPAVAADEPHAPGSAIPAEIYDLPIDILDLTTRTYNALKRADITKIGQILEKDDKALASIRNFGARSVEEVKDKLREHGYRNVERTPEPALEVVAV